MINEDKIREVWASNPERGFKLLIDFFQQPIYWHIRRLVVSHEDAEDILQEVFIRVFRHLPQFREESSLGTWIYRIATNENEMAVKFQQAILMLPEKQRVVFNLRYYDELEYEEISRITDTKVDTLKVNYHYAKEKIKEYMINN